MVKLNLGCGSNHLEGWVNVDKYEPADVVFDLESFCGRPDWIDYAKWPWYKDTVDEVNFYHSLEHMGKSVDGFLHIIRELYRVCKNNAKITITVPHPRHDDFLNDPTHVRIITPMILDLFSKKKNEAWAKEKAPNTPLAIQLNVDFEIIEATAMVDDRFKHLPEPELREKLDTCNNIIKQYTFKLRVVK